jgi:hypothetical protein
LTNSPLALSAIAFKYSARLMEAISSLRATSCWLGEALFMDIAIFAAILAGVLRGDSFSETDTSKETDFIGVVDILSVELFSWYFGV